MASRERRAPTSLRLGFISGFHSPYGILVENQYKGAELAVAEANRAGGISGLRLELVARDDRMDVELARKVTRELIAGGVDLLAGTLSAATQLVINEEAKRAGIPFVSCSQSNQIITAEHLGPYTFHEALTPYMTAQLVGRWGVEHLGKRWFFIIPDYEWGWENYESYRILLQRMGGTDAGVAKIRLGADSEDFERSFPEVLRAKPDVLSVTNLGRDQVNFIKAAHAAGLKKEVSIVIGIADITLAEAVAMEEAVGMYWGTNFYWGLEDRIPSAKRFVAAFREAFGGALPTGYAGYAYAGVKELLAAAEETGGYPLRYADLARFLEGRTYDHYKGPQWWRPCDHQSFQDLYILKFKGPEESAHRYDIGEILGAVSWDLEIERSCQDLGQGDHAWGHLAPRPGLESRGSVR